MTTIGTRNVLITGGVGGIGRLMALKMAALGAGVAIWDINEQRLPAVVDELKTAGARDAQGFVCDVSDRAAVYRAATETTASFGAVDILVNNAGVVSGKLLLEIADEQIERTFRSAPWPSSGPPKRSCRRWSSAAVATSSRSLRPVA